MNKVWAPEAWTDYIWWQTQDRKTLKRINSLIKDIERNGLSDGMGKPEALRGDLSGFWSRRIDGQNRLVYRIAGVNIEIASCKSHYGDHSSSSDQQKTRRSSQSVARLLFLPLGFHVSTNLTQSSLHL